MAYNLPWLEHQWQKNLSEAVSDPQELFSLLNLSADLLPQAYLASKSFKLRVPHGFIARMNKGDVRDPLLMQILPAGKELISPIDYLIDPLHEQAKNVLPGLLHKYTNRVLLFVSSACPVHCRYCFRRHFNYAENNLGRKGWEQIVNYIRNQPEIEEVILSGGDPLTVNDRYFAQCIQMIDNIKQIKKIKYLLK